MTTSSDPATSSRPVPETNSSLARSSSLGPVLSFKSEGRQVFFGAKKSAEPAHRSYTPPLKCLLTLSLGANLLIALLLLLSCWFYMRDDIEGKLHSVKGDYQQNQTEIISDITLKFAGRQHAVVGDQEVMAINQFIAQPLRVLKSLHWIDPPFGEAMDRGAAPTDATLKLLLWQLQLLYDGVEGVFYADGEGVYAEYERQGHHDDPSADADYTLEYIPGDSVDAEKLRRSCPFRCPGAEHLRPWHKSVFSVESNGSAGRLLERYAFDARNMTWYQSAVAARGQVVWDGPRLWNNTLRYRAVQAAFEGGKLKFMVGADFTLTYLARFLATTEMARNGSMVFVLNAEERLISSSQPVKTLDTGPKEPPHWSNISSPTAIRKISNEIWGNRRRILTEENVTLFEDGKKVYIYSTKNFTREDGDKLEWVIVNVQDYSLYTEELKSLTNQFAHLLDAAFGILRDRMDILLATMVIICGVILCGELAATFFVGQAVTVPIKHLQGDMLAVAKLDFDKMINLSRSSSSLEVPEPPKDWGCCGDLFPCLHSRRRSCVREIEEIRDSFTSMTAGLQSFVRYMDPSLVRMLVESKRRACLGVAKADVTIFFSDIANFTTMAETVPQEHFLGMLGDYLDGMSNIIMSQKGIVGEFIGDAIMAWWNAPEDLGDGHTVLALTAALKQQDCLQGLRERWAGVGLPEVRVRMGLARGEVLAGNIGSRKRMKYGLVGDTVNLASRLENLCKRYGVSILIDDMAADAPGVREEFLLRPLGLVTVKGRTQQTELFELVGYREKEGENEAFCSSFAEAQAFYRAADFDRALAVLDSFESRWPGDRPAAMLRRRCEDLCKSPVSADWSPVETMLEK